MSATEPHSPKGGPLYFHDDTEHELNKHRWDLFSVLAERCG